MKFMDARAKKAVFDLVFAVNDLQGSGIDRARGWIRPAQKIALTVWHIKADEGCQLFFRFYALGNDARIGEGRKFLHALDQRLPRKVLIHTADELHIELDKVRLHVGYEVEAGIARARVVNADLVVLPLVVLDDLLEAAQVHHRFALGNFKNNVFSADGKAGQIFLGEPHAEVRILNNIGIYIEEQTDARGHLACGAQGAAAEKMLKLQHAAMFQRALDEAFGIFKRGSGRAAPKRLIAEYCAVAQGDNGLQHACDGLILKHIQQSLSALLIVMCDSGF